MASPQFTFEGASSGSKGSSVRNSLRPTWDCGDAPMPKVAQSCRATLSCGLSTLELVMEGIYEAVKEVLELLVATVGHDIGTPDIGEIQW